MGYMSGYRSAGDSDSQGEMSVDGEAVAGTGQGWARERAEKPWKRWRLRMLVLHSSLIAGAAALNPSAGTWGGFRMPRFCLFRELTGVECPACGLTRSVSCALRGDIAMAVSYHPAGVLVAFLAVCLVGYFAVALLYGEKWPVNRQQEARLYAAVDGMLVIILFVVWLIRIY